MSLERVITNFLNNTECSFNLPASSKLLLDLENTIGLIPKELTIILTFFNGENASNITPANNLAFFLNIEDISTYYNMCLEEESNLCLYPESHPIELQKVIFDKHWIPFMNIDGDVYFIDYNPTAYGVKGQIFMINIAQGMDYYEIVENSLKLLLTKLAHNK